jgi:DNA-binding transcriptional LysR family regulator
MQSSALRYFFEVVRCRSIRRASERLHIAPSAISRQIAKLESELKAPLFERHVNGLALTEAGRIVAEYASNSAKHLDRLRGAIDDITHLRRGHVVIATVEAMVEDFLPRCLAGFHEKYPGITATVNVVGTQDVADAVVSGDADIGLAFNADKRPELKVLAAFPQPLHAILAPTHPYASMRTLSLANLHGFRVALPNYSFGIRVLIEKIAKETSCEMLRVLETNNLEMAKGLVRLSNAITFMPFSAVVRDVVLGDLVAIPMVERAFSTTTMGILAASDRALPRAVEALLADLRSAVSSAATPPSTALHKAPGVARPATPAAQN